MASVECVLYTGDRVLLTRASEGAAAGSLRLVGGKVREGESPLQACVREVEARTGLRIIPSCAGLFFVASPGHIADYGLAFVAEASALAETADPALEWLALSELATRTDLTPADRDLIPRLLATDHPLAIVLAPDLETDPATRHVVAVSAMDAARLSPLVFAVLPES